LDSNEGDWVTVIHRSAEQGDQTISAHWKTGSYAYVVSASMKYDQGLMSGFDCDSYIRIHNPTEFGARISRQIPGFRSGGEGPCLYQANRIVGGDGEYVDPKRFKTAEDLGKFINDKAQHIPFFIKHNSFAHQVEYRMIWITDHEVNDFLDIKCPEAVELCSRPTKVFE